jgi:hypothetical protein
LATDEHALLLQISADNTRLLKSFDQIIAKVSQGADQVEARTKRMTEKVGEHSGILGEGLGKALDKVFSSSRLTVLEEGAARISVFGGALEALGPVGLGAAAAIGAFTLTMEPTEKAVEFAASIAKIATEVGVTTDFIQKFNFAAHQNEIDINSADASLKALNASLGLVQSGLAKTQLVRAFAAVGFTPDQLRQFHDVGDLFPVLAERITKIGDAAEEAAVAKRLGIEELLPMLKNGADGFDALAKKAEDLGIVMSHGTIERAEEAKKKLSELDDVMKAKANITFAEFSDTLIKVKEAFLGAETAALRFLAAITGTMPATVESLKQLQAELARLTDKQGNAKSAFFVGSVEHDRAEIARIQGILDAAKKEETPAAKDKARALVPPTSTGRKSDSTLEFDKAAADAYNTGLRALLQAQAALLVDVQARATAEKAAVSQDLTKKLKDLDLEEQKIRESKNDRHKAEQLALIEKAQAEEKNATKAKLELIDRQAAEAIRKQGLAYAQQQLDGETQQIDLEQQLTFSEQLRQKYALQLVDLAYQRTRAELEGVLASQTASDADKKLARLKLQQLQAEQGLRVEGARRTGSGPAQQANSAVAGVKQRSNLAADQAQAYAEIDRLRKEDVINEREAAQAKAQINADYNAQRLQNAQSFFGNLATLSQSSNQTLAAIGKAAAIAQATIDGVLAVQKALASAPPPFSFALAAAAGAAAAVNVAKIAGLADGGWVDGPGGPRDDKVLRRLSNKEFVVNADAAAKHGSLLQALNAGLDVRHLLPAAPLITPASGGGAVSNVTNVNFTNGHTIHNNNQTLSDLLRSGDRDMRRWVDNGVRNGVFQNLVRKK